MYLINPSQECIKKKNNQDGDEEKIQGSCQTMCPKEEESLRVREKMVHVLEKCGTDLKLVKSYRRSAADSNMAVPDQLRPFPILQATVTYLILDVTKRSDVPISVVYDFVNDRLKAVRQDMTIQRLSYKECAHLLEPMIRFYVYYGYRLHGIPLQYYDPVLNKNYLLDCQKWFLKCCDNTHDLNYDDDFMTPSELSDLMVNMNLEPGTEKLTCDPVLMECLYILCNLNDENPTWRCNSLPRALRRNLKLIMAYRITVNYKNGNFVRVFKILRSLCPLSHCAVSLFLPAMQRRGIKTLARAYSKRYPVPSWEVQRWLAFSCEVEAVAACCHYGMAVEGRAIRFFHRAYNPHVQMFESNIHHLKVAHLNLSIPYVFTYNNN